VADPVRPASASRLNDRRLYLCTPDRPDLENFLNACIDGGVDVVQLRDKELDVRPLLRRAALAARVCGQRGVPFIINDRPDLALECGADGVHVGQDDISPRVARHILGSVAIIGLSTHTPPQLAAALAEPVDYLSAGPVFPTPTKSGRPGTGLGYLSHVAARVALPWFVTGGVAPQTVGRMVTSGGRRFVVVRHLTEARDPRASARQLREAIDEAIADSGAGRDDPVAPAD
jgi:thiamine-phosphate pyrophosphorylase